MGALWEQFKAEARHEGRNEGRNEGRRDVLARLFERRMGRPLTAPERDALYARLTTLGDDRLSELVLDSDGPTLAAWLADPDAR